MEAPKPRSSAFAAVVHEHHAAVYRSALRVVRRPEDAEDVVQQVFARVFERFDELERAEDPRRVLCWMATRKGLELLRGARRRARHERSYARERSATAVVSETRETHGDEQRAALEQLDRLPDEVRLPLVLRFQEQMTFAAVGEALECSESTAHDRVTRGLAQLRRALVGSGVAVTAAGLSATLAAAEPVAVPQSLEGKLLALEGAGALTSGAGIGHAVIALVLAVVVGGAGAWWWFDDRGAVDPGAVVAADAGAGDGAGESTAPPAPELARVAVPRLAPAAPGSSPAGQDPVPHGVVTGYVHDASGDALAGVRVVAESSERRPGLKRARFIREVETEANGSFRLELPAVTATGQEYTLRFTRDGLETQRREVTVVAGRDAPFQRVAMGAASGRANAVTLAVVDEAGQPLPGVAVELYAANTHPSVIGNWRVDSRGETGAAGRVELRWEKAGGVLAWVNGRRVGREAVLVSCELGAGPVAEQRIVLQPARRITGTVRMLAGQRPEHMAVGARDEKTGVTIRARVAADGSFAFDGLGEGPYAISGSAVRFSSFTVRGVRGGTSDLAIEMKPWDDPTDRGHHLAEVHGSVVDARTEEPMVVGPWNVEAVWVRPGTTAEEVLGDLVCESPVQRGIMFKPEPSSQFHCGGLKAGSWLVVGKQRDYAVSWAGPFELADDQLIRDVRLEMRRGGTIRGTVTDPRGRPVGGAVVFVVPPGELGDTKVERQDETVAGSEGRDTSYLHRQVRSDAGGRYQLEHMSSELPLRVVAVHPGWQPVILDPTVLREGETSAVKLSFRVPR